jgi:hypothetical protein
MGIDKLFFANWQSQAGRLLLEATTKAKVKDLVRAFLFELHDLVIESGFYDRVARQPEAQACVEVACGLEGLADAYAIAASSQDRRMGDYRRCVLTALGFLLRTADDRLHRQRTRWLWRPARNSRAADRRNRPCGERIHQECRKRDQRTSEVTVATSSPNRPAIADDPPCTVTGRLCV